MHRKPSFYFLVTIFAVWNFVSAAYAQTWNGANYPASNWSSAANWTGGLPSNNGSANVVFSSANSVTATLDQNWNINTLSLSGNQNAGTVIVDGSSILTLQNGLTSSIVQSGFPEASLAVGINLSAVQPWNITTSDLPVTGVISGSGGITKTGAGNLTLNSGNTYRGGTIIGAGSIAPTDDTSFGDISGQLRINGGALSIATYDHTDLSFLKLSRSILLGSGGGTVNVTRNLELACPISGAGPLTLTNAGAAGLRTPDLTLSGTSTFSGGLSIIDGLNPPTQFPWLVKVSGTGRSLGNGPVTLSPGTTLSIDAESNIGAGKTINVVGQSALVLTSDSIDPTHVIAPASTQSMLELGAPIYNRALNLAAYGDGSLTLGVSTVQTVTYTAPSLQPGAGNVYRLGGGTGTLAISGSNVLAGSASLFVSGTVDILAPNSFTGGTSVSGNLGIGTGATLGTGTVTLAAGAIRAVGGASTLTNPLVLQSRGTFFGPLTFTGPVDLGGGTPVLFVNSAPVTFANVISHGVLNLNNGLAILQGANTFSELDLWEGAASISSVNNLGGPNTVLNFDGIFYYDIPPTTSGMLETTASMTLTNPITFHRTSNAFATFQVDSGTTLTLTQTIAGQVNKTGTGDLVLSSSCSLSRMLSVYGGTTTSGGNTLRNGGLQTSPGGRFIGTGPIQTFTMLGGEVAPGGGTGGIVASNIAISPYYGKNSFQFQFTQSGSPNYANLSNSGNGFISFGVIGSAATFNGSTVSLFLSAPAAQLGSLYKGAIFLQSTSPISPTLFYGTVFNFYVPSTNGTTTFNGQKFSPLDPGLYAVQQSWVTENGGQVTQFKIVPTLGSPPATASLGTPFNFAFSNSGNATFAVTTGSLPPGLALSPAGALSGAATKAGSYAFTIAATDSTGANTLENLTLTVAPALATDTPTLPQWALFVLAVLIFFSATRPPAKTSSYG